MIKLASNGIVMLGISVCKFSGRVETFFNNSHQYGDSPLNTKRNICVLVEKYKANLKILLTRGRAYAKTQPI